MATNETNKKDFEKIINNFLSEENSNPFINTVPDGELTQFIQSQTKAPVISTKIPTKRELEERRKNKENSDDNSTPIQTGAPQENIREVQLNDNTEIFFKNSDDVNEKIIFVNREKDSQGEIKRDLAIYNIDNDFITEIRKEVTERIPDVFKNFTPFKHDAVKSGEIKRQIERAIQSKGNMKVGPTSANVDAIADEIMGLGPLSLLTTLPDVTEIMVVDYDNIYVEMEGVLRRVENVKFKDRKHLSTVIERMVGLMGESINFENPILDMRLSDGSRVNIVGPPLTEHDHLYLLTIRRFRDTRFTLNDLLKRDTISPDMYQYLSNIMKSHANVLLCGGTGSGKTSTLEALVMEKDPNECVITVEDTRELMLKRQNWRPMKSKKSGATKDAKDIDIRQLVKSALRMRPDSIIVGETRDATAYDILFAMNSGHDGCCTTVHANNSIQALSKFEMLAKMAKDEAPPTDALREIVVECFDVVISVGRTPEGLRKMMSVDEVVGYNEETHRYEVMNVFKNIQVNDDPTQPGEYRFVSNPEYYTVEKLAFKMSRWGIPFVPPKGVQYPFSNIGAAKLNASSALFALPNKEKPGRKLTEWEKLERETEQARMEARRKADQERIKALREAQKEEAKARRRKQREQARTQQIIEREERKNKEKVLEKAKREKAKEEKQAKILQEKRERHEALRNERLTAKKQKTEYENNNPIIKQEVVYEEMRQKEYNKLIANGYSHDDALKEANLILISNKLEGKNIPTNDPWRVKNMPKALIYKKMMEEKGLTPEQIAEIENVTVNNILKYLKIVSPNFVKQYQNLIKTTPTKSNQKIDKVLAEVEAISSSNTIDTIPELHFEKQSILRSEEEKQKIQAKIFKNSDHNENKSKLTISDEDLEGII